MLFLIAAATAFATPTEEPSVTAQMHESFQLSTRARDHVMQGRLDEARDFASTLVDLDPPVGLPGTWRPWLAQLKAQAAALAAATDLRTASAVVGEIGTACADCHREMGGGPTLARIGALPPQEWTEGYNMPLHRWAVDWMWLGLVASDDAAWRRGASALDDRPLAPVFGELPPGAEPKEIERRTYDIAAQALQLTGNQHTERGEVMGQMLLTCAECHTLRDRGQVAPPPAEPPAAPDSKPGKKKR